MTKLNPTDIENYQQDGVVILRGVFEEWMETLIKGADYHINHPSNNALVHHTKNNTGKFLEDFCNWQRIADYHDFINHSPMAELAAQLMQSNRVQFFHDHYLHKDAGSNTATPWHQDMPYYCVQGEQTASFWIPLEARTTDNTLRCAAKTHRLPKETRPTRWSTNQDLYPNDTNFINLPDIDNSDFDIKTWATSPGDAIVFNFKTIHSASANSKQHITRALSFRLLGDDVRFIKRSGKTSPNFDNINQQSGEKLRQDWFPILKF